MQPKPLEEVFKVCKVCKENKPIERFGLDKWNEEQYKGLILRDCCRSVFLNQTTGFMADVFYRELIFGEKGCYKVGDANDKSYASILLDEKSIPSLSKMTKKIRRYMSDLKQ